MVQAEGTASTEALRWACAPARLVWGQWRGSRVCVCACTCMRVCVREALAFCPREMGATVEPASTPTAALVCDGHCGASFVRLDVLQRWLLGSFFLKHQCSVDP